MKYALVLLSMVLSCTNLQAKTLLNIKVSTERLQCGRDWSSLDEEFFRDWLSLRSRGVVHSRGIMDLEWVKTGEHSYLVLKYWAFKESEVVDWIKNLWTEDKDWHSQSTFAILRDRALRSRWSQRSEIAIIDWYLNEQASWLEVNQYPFARWKKLLKSCETGQVLEPYPLKSASMRKSSRQFIRAGEDAKFWWEITYPDGVARSLARDLFTITNPEISPLFAEPEKTFFESLFSRSEFIAQKVIFRFFGSVKVSRVNDFLNFLNQEDFVSVLKIADQVPEKKLTQSLVYEKNVRRFYPSLPLPLLQELDWLAGDHPAKREVELVDIRVTPIKERKFLVLPVTAKKSGSWSRLLSGYQEVTLQQIRSARSLPQKWKPPPLKKKEYELYPAIEP